MIHLIGDPSRDDWGVEQVLAARGLAVISDYLKVAEDLYVYGCGSFIPGRDYDELVAHSQAGDLLGVLALWFTEQSVCSLHHELRAHLGAILQLAPSVYVPDKLGAGNRGKGEEGNGGWCLHYGVAAKLGGHPAWCATPTSHVPPTLLGLKDTKAQVATTVGEIVNHALLSEIFAIQPPVHPWGSAHNVVYAEVRRFVEQVGLSSHVQHPAVVSPDILAREHKRAVDTVKEMYEIWRSRSSVAQAPSVGDVASSVWARVAGACAMSADPADISDAQVPSRTFAQFADETDRVLTEEAKSARELLVARRPRPRELVIGTPFDPKTHYTEEYFGEGAGLSYTRPDGTKDVYHGPAHEWDGMRAAADFLWRVYRQPKPAAIHPKLSDIGCGSGCFVGHAARVGFAAKGYDISEAAVKRAAAAGRGHLVELRNVVENPPAEKVDIITALDFWEHIYTDDLDTLVTAVRNCLAPGGVGFFIICTRTAAEQDWTIVKGYRFDKAASWLAASGHLTIRLWEWWMDLFKARGFEPENNIAYNFQVLRDQETGLTQAESWKPKNLVCVRKV